MNTGKTALAQVLAGISGKEFSRCSSRYPMRRDTPALSAYDHFATMVFAQLTYRESLRDIEVCLNARRGLLYHAGIRGTVKRCNLAYANEHRDWRLFAEVAGVLMRRARRMYAGDPTPLDLDADLFALDATLIELSLALFPWARWQGTQAAVKLNVLLDLRADLPAFASLHEGDRHEVASLDEIPVCPGAYYVMDRGYLDFARLHRLHAMGAFFVTRLKTVSGEREVMVLWRVGIHVFLGRFSCLVEAGGGSSNGWFFFLLDGWWIVSEGGIVERGEGGETGRRCMRRDRASAAIAGSSSFRMCAIARASGTAARCRVAGRARPTVSVDG